MVNGIFGNDAERDRLIVCIEEKQREIIEDIKEIKEELKAFIRCNEERVRRIEGEVSQLKVWVGIFSAVFIPLVIYLLQKAMQ